MRSWFTFLHPSRSEWLEVGGRRVRLLLVRHARSRCYRLRLRTDGSARVTVPRGGSLAAARRFAEGQLDWLEAQLKRLDRFPAAQPAWRPGMELLFRGERVRLEADPRDNTSINLGALKLSAAEPTADLRPAIEWQLRRLAEEKLPPRVRELANLHQLSVRRVTVRNQRTRWGSCSPRGTISLNWRLIQTPPFVCDYIILHELMHLRELNHSPRYWQQVGNVCPDYLEAERWLKQHAGLLRG